MVDDVRVPVDGVHLEAHNCISHGKRGGSITNAHVEFVEVKLRAEEHEEEPCQLMSSGPRRPRTCMDLLSVGLTRQPYYGRTWQTHSAATVLL